MAPVSGFVFRAKDEPVTYLAGDTIWYDEVEEVTERHSTAVIVVKAGCNRLPEGGQIVRTADDVASIHHAALKATVVVMHLKAINHCLETRDDYRQRLPGSGRESGQERHPGRWVIIA